MRTLVTVAVLAVLTVLHFAARAFHLGSFAAPGDESTFVLGFALLAAYIFGRTAHQLRLPRITGFLLAGVALGPFVGPLLVEALLLPVIGPASAHNVAAHAAVLNPSVSRELRLFENVALGLIAFTAGGELRLDILRQRGRTILGIVWRQTLFVFVAVTLVLALVLAKLAGPGASAPAWLTAILLASIAIAKSPAETIAVIGELRSRGPLTDTALGVTVVKDVAVLLVFTLVTTVAQAIAAPERGTALDSLGSLAWHLGGSLVIGGLLGLGVRFYVEHIQSELPLVVLGIAALAMFLAGGAHLSGLLICMTAGFVVENTSEHGSALVEAAERFSLPVYVVFFTLAGASIDLGTLGTSGVLALALFLTRLLASSVATYLAHRAAGDPPALRRWGWSAYIGQAGVSLGLAAIVRDAFPAVGPTIFSVVVATVALNLLVGPVLFRLGLVRAGEAHAD